MMPDRLERAEAFIAHLERLSIKTPHFRGGDLKASVVMSVLRMRTSTNRSVTPKRPGSSNVALTMRA